MKWALDGEDGDEQSAMIFFIQLTKKEEDKITNKKRFWDFYPLRKKKSLINDSFTFRFQFFFVNYFVLAVLEGSGNKK